MPVTRDQFAEWCRTSAWAVEVEVGADHVWPHDRSVRLRGVWCDGSILTRDLETPFPGRQWDKRHVIEDRLEAALTKYRQWLAEWRQTEAFAGGG